MPASPGDVPAVSDEPLEALFAKLPPGPPGPGRDAATVASHQRGRLGRALSELSIEQGYRNVTLRELTRRASVSSKSFYEQHSSKEACLLSSHLQLVRGLLRRLDRASAGSADWREHVRCFFTTFVRELAHDPLAARMLLIEIYAGGPVAVEQARRTNQLIACRLREHLARAPRGAELPPFVAEAMVHGVISVVRSHLLSDSEESSLTSDLGDQLVAWALSSHQAVLGASPAESGGGQGERRDGVGAPASELAILFIATARLAAAEGYDALTTRRILAAAGLPRRSFKFAGVEDCFVAALEFQGELLLAELERVAMDATTPADGIRRMVEAIVGRASRDSGFPSLCPACVGSPGILAMRSRERLLAGVRQAIEARGPLLQPRERVAVEASVGAFWGALEAEIASDRVPHLTRIAGAMASLIAAPFSGSTETASAPQREHVMAA